jgi:hypothetical protein
MIKDHVLLPFASRLEEADAIMAGRVTPEVIAAVVALLPPAWMSDDAPGGAANSPQVYAAYLQSRLESRQVFVEESIRARSRHV